MKLCKRWLSLALFALVSLIAACGPGGPGTVPGPGPEPGEDPGVSRPGTPRPKLVISGFYVAPLLKGGPEESFWIENVGTEPVDVADFSLSDVFGPSAGAHYVARGQGLRRDIVFPRGEAATLLRPGEELVVARDAVAFRDQFGALPDFEYGEDGLFPDDHPDVPNMPAEASATARRGAKSLWPTWPASGADVIALFGAPDATGDADALDVVVYDFKPKKPNLLLQNELREYEQLHSLREGALWDGPALNLRAELASPYGLKTRVLVRDRDVEGRILADTNTFRDWNCGSSLQHLGEDPTHRIEMAGQSRFLAHRSTSRALVTMTAAPDNNFGALVAALDGAKKDIKVRIYYFKVFQIADALVRAVERGVDVTLFLEGTTVGEANGFADAEREIARMIESAGRERSGIEGRGLGRVYWMRTDAKEHVADRYWYDHSKYVIIDDRAIIVGSENYGMSGHPVDPSYGNRGWEIQIATPPGEEPLPVVQALLAVWNDDLDPENHRDIIRYTDDPASLDPTTGRGRFGPPPPGYDPTEDRAVPSGPYVPVRPAETVEDNATVELVLSPDTSLNETTGILGAIAAAEKEILVQHLDLRLYWGSRVKHIARTPLTTPNLLIEALLAAARRGVRVRVLLDCSRFDCNTVSEERDPKRDNNDDTVAYLREIAAREKLDLEARLIDIQTPEDVRWEDREDAGIEKIHNKGLVIDGRQTLVGSINGSENSFKGNREVAVLVTSEKVAEYYRYLFYFDWSTIAAPRNLVAATGAIPGGSACAEDGKRTGFVVTGLAPDTEYWFAVTAYDSDRRDRCPLDHDLMLGPHESAFSHEAVARSSATGEIGLLWDANVSESREHDLAGYRVYFGLVSGAGAASVGDAKRLGVYTGTSTRLGPSPLDTPGGCPL